MTDKIIELLENQREEIVSLGRRLFENPELGYKEYKTRELLLSYIKDIELTSFEAFALTGFKATVGEGKPHIALLFDMDALPTKGHKLATNEDMAAHSCGHNAQMALMAAAFKTISESGLLKETRGTISLIAAPAEEFVDFDFRKNLIKERKIKTFSGKQNMIAAGAFDNVDIVIGSHGNGLPGAVIETGTASNGFIAKTAIFKGVSAHSGAYPHLGRNALNAAILAIQAVGLLRETFQDDHHIRFHPVIKEGGDAVNTVPHRVKVETYVRGSTVAAINDANDRINNAFVHSAKALGCECEIEDIPGYLPSNYFVGVDEYFHKRALEYVSTENLLTGGRTFASDDIADVSNLKPVLHFGFSGFGGSFHGADFYILDEDKTYLNPAKLVALTVADMLMDKEKLTAALKAFRPTMTKEAYVKNWLNLKQEV